MIRLLCAIAGAVSCVVAVAANSPVSTMPRADTAYVARLNCHGAYDIAGDDAKAGRLAPEARSWATAYEAAATAKRPCPDAPASLLSRAANRTIVNPASHGEANAYRNAGDLTAAMELAVAAMSSKMPKVDPASGFLLLRDTAQKGYAPAQFGLASLHIVNKDHASALPLLEAAAASGHTDALFLAGTLHRTGLGTKVDHRKAFGYFRQAAERGHQFATIMAFNALQNGEGTSKNFDLAYALSRNLAPDNAYGAIMAASALLQSNNPKAHEDEVMYWVAYAERYGDAALREHVAKVRPLAVAAYQRAKIPPPAYKPSHRKQCPMKQVCYVNRFSGSTQSCTTNVDYWNC